jgi:hypothetical protein
MTATSEIGPRGRSQAKTLTRVKERYSTYRYRPCGEEDKAQRRNHHREIRAKVLKYVVTIRRNNILWIASL